MDEELRKTGIDILGDVPWGTHFCQFYQTKEDLIDILVPYFKEGLENNEFCMWVTSEPLSEKEAEEAMRKALPHFDEFLKKGQIEIIPFSEWYVKDGAFNTKRVLKGWVDKLEKALSKDFDGMRLTGNTFWLEKKDWKSFTDYEKEVNSVIGTCKMIAVCTYSVDRCGVFELLDVVRNHQFALIRRKAKWELVESSERKKAKDEVARSEAKYRSLVENTGQGVATIDLKGRFTYVNETLCKMIGYDEEELLGKNLADFLHPDEKERIFNLFWEGLKTLRRRRLHLEFRVIHKKGHVLDWYSSPTAFRHKGRILGFSAIISDITGRKKAEEALKNSAREWHATFDAVSDSVFLTDLEGRILRCNRAMAKFLRKSFSEIIGRTYWELIHTAVGPVEGRRFMSMQKSHRRETMVFSISDRYFNITVDPLLNEDGDLSGAVQIMADITERKKVEEALRESEKKYRSLYESSKDGIVPCDIQGNFLDANAAFLDMLGYTIEEVKKLSYQRVTPKKWHETEEEIIKNQVMARGYSDQYEKEYIKKDGTVFPIAIRVWLIKDERGDPTGMWAIVRDITERKKAEKKIKAYQKRLRALASELTLTEEREKRHLATELHDSISQLLALCRIKLGELEKVARFSDSRSLVEEIEERLEEIIWHTRSLTLRLGPPVLYELGLGAALQWLAEYMQEQYGIQTKFKVDGEVELVDEDLRVFLFRAMQELMMNVAKHAKTDKAKILVWRENDRMRITVEDRGVGFNAADLETSSGKDTGFGLFNIREHVKYFGGELSIQSKPGEGTQVTLMVPLKVPETKT